MDVLDAALAEDLGPGDLTRHLFRADDIREGYIEAQGEGVLCGVGLAAAMFGDVADVDIQMNDGAPLTPDDVALAFEGPIGELLSRERTALNFIMHLSGVATLTSQFVKAVAGTDVQIVDTRKTLPGLRSLQKYAVRCGGGVNHRLGLFDAAMIKDNHIQAAGSISKAVKTLRQRIPFTAKIEVECESEAMVREAVDAGADIVMLDNMSPAAMRPICERYRGKVLLEASGGISLKTVRAVAESGVNFISVGALTHSAVAVPFHLELVETQQPKGGRR